MQGMPEEGAGEEESRAIPYPGATPAPVCALALKGILLESPPHPST